MPKIARREDQHGSAERGADNLTRIARPTTRQPSAERGADNLTKFARSTAQQGADAARDNNERARTAATATAEQIVHQSADEQAELGRTIVNLLGEQTRHNMQFATAFGRAVNWGQVAEMQREFLTGSFSRMNQLAERYRLMMQAGMKSMGSLNRR